MAESKREFVDTNIFVYAHDRSASVGMERERALSLLEELWNSGSGCLSVQVLQELFNALTRKLAAPVDPEEAYRLIQDYSAWTTHAPDALDVLEAIRVHQEYRISFWDALIVRSAATLHCAVLWTPDLNDGQVIEGVLIKTPFTEPRPGSG